MQTDENAAGQTQGDRSSGHALPACPPFSVLMGCSIHSLLADATYCHQDCRPARKCAEKQAGHENGCSGLISVVLGGKQARYEGKYERELGQSKTAQGRDC